MKILESDRDKKPVFWGPDEAVLNWFLSRLAGLFKRYGAKNISPTDFDLLEHEKLKQVIARPQFQKDLKVLGIAWEDLFTLALEKAQEEEQKSNEEIVRTVGKGIFH